MQDPTPVGSDLRGEVWTMARLFRVCLLLILAAVPLAGCASYGSSPQNAAPGHLLPNGLTPEPWGETS